MIRDRSEHCGNLPDDHLRAIAISSVIAALMLLPLLPLGIWLGPRSVAYHLVWGCHIAALASATWIAGKAIWRMQKLSPLPFFLPVTAVSLLLVGALGTLPVTSRDALIHHLAVPKWWLLADTIQGIPWHEWSYYPSHLHLAFPPFIAAGIPEGIAIYHALYLVLLSCTTAVVARREIGPRYGLWTFLLTLTLPVAFRLGSVPLIDLALAHYAGLAVWYGAKWVDRNDVGAAILSGSAIGIACSIKPNGILLTLTLSLACFASFLIRFREYSIRRRIISAAAGVMVCVLVAAPSFARSYAWTGNPVFPLFRGDFSTAIFTATPPPQERGAAPRNALETRVRLYDEDFVNLVLLPVRMFFTGRDDDPTRFDGVLSPLLVLSLVPAVRRSTAMRIAYCALLPYLGISLYSASARVRYLAPLFGPIIVLTMGALHRLETHRVVRARIVGGMLAAQLIYNLAYMSFLPSSSGMLMYFTSLDRERYLAEKIPEYPVISYLNRELGDSTTTLLLLTGNRFFYYDRPVISGGHFSADPIISVVRSARSAADIASALLGRGITHLCAHSHLASAALEAALSPEEMQRWSRFVEGHLRPLTHARGFGLWKIEPPGAP